MKYNVKSLATLLCIGALTMVGCSDEWDDHYDTVDSLETTSEVEVFDGAVDTYIAGQSDLSSMKSMFDQHGLTSAMKAGNYCTVIVTENEHIKAEDALGDSLFACNLVSEMPVAPTTLVPDFGIYMKSGKNLWVTTDSEGKVFLNEQAVTKVVKTTNGYVYYVESLMSCQRSVYEYIQSLGDEYSIFKSLIAEFEEPYFNAELSTPSGVDEMGNTVYSDSVIDIRNTLMDRFTESGLATWNMRSESFQSTVFIPSDELIERAYRTALDSIPAWLNRSVTAADSLKFRKWMLSSFFVDRQLSPEEVSADVEGQFECVGGYIEELDEVLDSRTYTEYEAAQWKPSVQIVDYTQPIKLANGVVYMLTDYKIPNHVVIWRAKARFYQVWSALETKEERGWDDAKKKPVEGGYFKWTDWVEPAVVSDAQSAFELSATLPTMYYHVLTAMPSAQAQADSSLVGVEYVGLMYNAEERDYGLKEVSLPAGEYYLRMGFKHSLRYSISIYFGDADEELTDEHLCVKDMSMIATGSNFHFDRGGAMEGLDFFGSESIGYPEYFDWRWWYDQDPDLYQKASAYDTDGYQVAIVTIDKPGNFKIKVTSKDCAELYSQGTQDRTKGDVYQLMMYHWTLRPTKNNY